MKTVILILSLLFCSSLFAQVTDTDIVNSLLGEKYYTINPKLDSLGVWHHIHLPEKFKDDKKVYSIADGDGTVKVFTMQIFDGVIKEIKINYRHDSKEQIEDAMKITTQSSFNVGHYSTDMVFTYKK